MSGVLVVSVRREPDRDTLRAAAYAHVGLAVDAVDLDATVLAPAFTDAGFGVGDLIALIEGIHTLGTAPETTPGDVYNPFGDRGGVDSEGYATDLFMLATEPGAGEWLACAEAAHAVWPRLLDTLGASIGGVLIENGTDRRLDLPGTRVPKSLRLKSGWDYDAEGNQVWLPIEEAWRRFVAHNDARTAEGRMDAKTMRRMRKHMEGFYAERAQPADGSTLSRTGR